MTTDLLYRLLGWASGFFGAAVLVLLLALGVRWAVYLWHVIRNR
ncbi:hypothetical protein VSR82_07795 [Burkholderia sp. JPY481]